MTSFLSDADHRRIEEFIATPKYEREPEMLVPEQEG
jgi:hypothetical protein